MKIVFTDPVENKTRKGHRRMKIYKTLLTLALFLGCLGLAGCQCQMTGIAPSTTPITGNDSYTVIGPVTTRSFGCVLLGAIPICEDNPSGKCLAKALEKSGGNALIEATQDTTYMLLPYVYPYWTRLKGTAVKVERGGAKN